MKKTSNHYPRGATSLLVVVGLALLLLVIVTGLTVLSIRESRQALNTDLSNRALAAATASARDAAQLLNADPNLQVPDCSGSDTTIIKSPAITLTAQDLEKPVLSNASDNQTTIQCRTITSVASTFTQEIEKDKSTQFFTYLPGNVGISKMNLLWGDGTAYINSFTGTVFPSGWPRGVPAAMEVSLIYWPKVAGQPTGTVASLPPDGLPVRTVVLLPRSTNSDPGAFGGQTVSNINCGGGKNGINNQIYSCSSSVSLSSILGPRINSTDYNIVVKLKPRYLSTTPIQVQFFSDTVTPNEPIKIQSTIATIDITAKVGDLYRRIQAQKPVASNSFIDDVLYSQAKICKNLSVHQDLSLVSDNCPR